MRPATTDPGVQTVALDAVNYIEGTQLTCSLEEGGNAHADDHSSGT